VETRSAWISFPCSNDPRQTKTARRPTLTPFPLFPAPPPLGTHELRAEGPPGPGCDYLSPQPAQRVPCGAGPCIIEYAISCGFEPLGGTGRALGMGAMGRNASASEGGSGSAGCASVGQSRAPAGGTSDLAKPREHLLLRGACGQRNAPARLHVEAARGGGKNTCGCDVWGLVCARPTLLPAVHPSPSVPPPCAAPARARRAPALRST